METEGTNEGEYKPKFLEEISGRKKKRNLRLLRQKQNIFIG